ncbi:hypothetical protein F4703DRAFT_1863801 [Phycomyces blakesleeanus]
MVKIEWSVHSYNTELYILFSLDYAVSSSTSFISNTVNNSNSGRQVCALLYLNHSFLYVWENILVYQKLSIVIVAVLLITIDLLA